MTNDVPFIKVCFDDVNLEKLNEFRKIHDKCFDSCAIGGKYTYSVTQTGLGYFVEIKCNACDTINDITNVENM